MAKRSSDEELLKKIHNILDNNTSNSSKSEQDQYLDSLKRRVNSHQKIDKPYQPTVQSNPYDLSPRVIIRKKEESKKEDFEHKKEIVEFKEYKSDYSFVPSKGVVVSDIELFEIINPFIKQKEIPEFIEVKPEKQQSNNSIGADESFKVTIDQNDEQDDSLPQWHAVDEEISSKNSKSVDTQDSSENKIETETITKDEGKPRNIWEPLPSEKSESNQTKKTRFKKIKKDTIIKDKKALSSTKSIKKNLNPSESNKDSPNKDFEYDGYKLYKKTIVINDEDKRTIHFFAKEPPEEGKPSPLPKGYEVKINRQTGVPYIRKKQ